MRCAAVGSPATVADWVQRFVARHRPDELIVTANIHDPGARLQSYSLAMQALSAFG